MIDIKKMNSQLPFCMSIRIIFIIMCVNMIRPVSCTQTCGDCAKNPSALWCGNPKSINATRCYVPTLGPVQKWSLLCNYDSTESRDFITGAPEAFTEVVDDRPFSNPDDNTIENIVQIKPQRVQLGLPAGGSQTVEMKFKYVSDYSLGLYYLMDLSKSMDQDRKTILALADTLVLEMQKLTPYFKLGFGTFLDKVNLPYVNTHSEWLKSPCSVKDECRRPYGFHNILSLTNDTYAFIDSVGSAKTSTNWDDPEGGLDALMQVMVCDSIGWEKKKTRHLIVYVSGSSFKYAGDGKLAGLTANNDMQCHLNDEGLYTHSSVQDYPSVSQIQQVSNLENMYVIFAVKKKVLPLYEALADLVTQSEASLLSDDSSNIIEIITNYYRDISHTLKLETSPANLGDVEISFRAKCGTQSPWKEISAQCEDVDVNKEIKFEITFKLKKCPESNKPLLISVSPEGLQDEMIVEIHSLCECLCQKESKSNAKECQGNGTLECGICLCNEGYTGEFCECQATQPSLDGTVRSSCRAVNDTSGKECNGRGTCHCDKCECKENIRGNPQWKYQGEYCEFSNFDCPRNKKGICSSNGICEFSRCICKDGWTKDDCSCNDDTDNCYSPDYYELCDGHGDCQCNQCQCHETVKGSNSFYFGQLCEDCQNCTGRCDYYESIVRQQTLGSDPVISNFTSSESSSSITVNPVQELSVSETTNMKICLLKKDNGCTVRFSYDPHVQVHVIFVEVETCPANALATQNILMIIVAGIVVLGVIFILLWKCWVTQKDKREYEKFLRETQEASFVRVENPLYKDPITRVTNPLHSQKETRKNL